MNGNEQQVQQPITVTPGIGGHSGAIFLMTNPEDELFQLELNLRGLDVDENGKLNQVSDPMCNNIGVRRIITSLRAINNRSVYMSNLDDNQIRALIELNIDALIQELGANRVKWEIKDFTTRTHIFAQILSRGFISLRRAYNQGERQFWKGSTQEVRHTTIQEGQKKGLLASLGFGK